MFQRFRINPAFRTMQISLLDRQQSELRARSERFWSSKKTFQKLFGTLQIKSRLQCSSPINYLRQPPGPACYRQFVQRLAKLFRGREDLFDPALALAGTV